MSVLCWSVIFFYICFVVKHIFSVKANRVESLLLRIPFDFDDIYEENDIVEEFTNLMSFVFSSCPSLKQFSFVFVNGLFCIDFADKCKALKILASAFTDRILPTVYGKFSSKKDVCVLIHFEVDFFRHSMVFFIIFLF